MCKKYYRRTNFPVVLKIRKFFFVANDNSVQRIIRFWIILHPADHMNLSLIPLSDFHFHSFSHFSIHHHFLCPYYSPLHLCIFYFVLFFFIFTLTFRLLVEFLVMSDYVLSTVFLDLQFYQRSNNVVKNYNVTKTKMCWLIYLKCQKYFKINQWNNLLIKIFNEYWLKSTVSISYFSFFNNKNSKVITVNLLKTNT